MPAAPYSLEQRLDPVSPYVVAAVAPRHTLRALETGAQRLVMGLGLVLAWHRSPTVPG